MEEIKNLLKKKYEELFLTAENTNYYFSPGRVNLIGEHTDYNGGHVFPCTLTIGTYAIVSKRKDKKIFLYSLNIKEKGLVQIDIDNISFNEKYGWANYVLGMVDVLKKQGYLFKNGFNMVVYGNIPVSSGLSSSASLEVLTGYILQELFDLKIDRISIALASQQDENQFIGVNCGIMDQFVIAMGKKNHALFLDTSSLEYKSVPIYLKDYALIIMNTNKPRGLKDSKYNERRSECERALHDLQKKLNIQSLCEITIEDYEDNKNLIQEEICRKRAKHVIYEDVRTKQAVKVLEEGNLKAFGELMNASHDSLKYDYEVTGIELDTLVSLARKVEGTIGARMTGAGFGGCAICLIKKESVQELIEKVGEEYNKQIGYAPSFYAVSIGDGPHKIEI